MHYLDIVVSSRENCTDGEVRLSAMNYNITETGAGLLEVCHSNMWGTVCDFHWDSSDSKVACRQMGYYDGCEQIGLVLIIIIPTVYFHGIN